MWTWSRDWRTWRATGGCAACAAVLREELLWREGEAVSWVEARLEWVLEEAVSRLKATREVFRRGFRGGSRGGP